MSFTDLVNGISPPLDQSLAEGLLNEFLDIEHRYVLADWEPATLNGGQLAEIAARLIYHIDSGNLNRRKGVDSCLKYVEDPQGNNSHAFPHRRTALHICRVVRTLYRFRSQRGAVHIDPEYTANELDSTLVVALARWIVSEILRVFWTGTDEEIVIAIKEIVRYEVPAVMSLDDRRLVLHTDCTIQEEILLLLHNAGEAGMNRTELGNGIPRPASSVTRALQQLASSELREIVERADDTYSLTPNGSRRVHADLASKLTLGD